MNTLFWLFSLKTLVVFTILYYSLYIISTINNPQVLYVYDITNIYCLSVCLPARLLSVDSVISVIKPSGQFTLVTLAD